MKQLHLLLFIVFSGTCAIAQVKTVNGIVKDSSKTVLQSATVSLYAFNVKRDTLNTITDEKGNFNFKNIAADDFKILVTSAGYGSFSKVYHYSNSSNNIDLGEIILSNTTKILEEVIVTADKTITIKEDTLEFKVDSFKLRPDADVEALLKKIPGVQVDASGNITAYGKSVNKIRVNGKDFFSGDIKTATKELPANIVDLVQIIDDYGDQAAFTGVKDGDPEKIINLQIKKDKNKGYFGRGQLGYGTDDRYTANGSINHFNDSKQVSVLANVNNTNTSTFNLPRPGGGGGRAMPDQNTMSTLNNVMSNGDAGFIQGGQTSNDGISRTNSAGINFRDDFGKKLSVYSSYTYTGRETVTQTNTLQTYLFNSGNTVNNQNSYKTENSNNHRVFFNAEWRIDSFNHVKISPSFSYSKTTSTTISDFLFNNAQNVKFNEGDNTKTTNSTQPNFSGNILYNHRFKKPGRLFSANFSGGQYTSDQDDDQLNNSIIYPPNGSGGTTSNQHQYITQETKNPSWSTRLSFTERLGKNKSLELNYTYNYNHTSNDRETNIITGNTSSIIDSLSNIYDNEFTYQRYGINYRYSVKKYNYSLGLAAQSNQMKGESFIDKSNFKQNTFNWFPLARFTYNFSRTRSFSLNYTGNVSAPSYSQLQPVYDYSNPQNPVIGNPDLKPEFKTSLSARYNNFDFVNGNILFSNLSVSFSKDKVVTNSVRKAGATAVNQETQYLNTDGYYSVFGFYTFSKPFKNRKYTVTANGNINYTNDISYVNSDKNINKNFTGTQGMNVDVRLSDWLEVGAGGSFTYNKTTNSLTEQANSEVRTYAINSNGKIYLPAKFVLNYDLSKTFNNGFGVTANPFIINGYIEKQFSKNNKFSARLSVFDLLNENTGISRTISANSITDTRNNRLGQYFMLSFNFRLQKFKGEQPKSQFPSGPLPDGPPPFMRGS